jgi:hypothetical protein
MTKPATRLRRITLTDFRSYARADLALDGRPVFLFGPNGAGKTNLLEAISLLFPGRGLRNAAIAEVGRRQPGEAQGRAWSVAAELAGEDEPVQLGTGTEAPGATRRIVRLGGCDWSGSPRSRTGCSWKAPPSAGGSLTGWCSPPNPSTPPTPPPTTAPSASACGCWWTAPRIRRG